MISVWTRHCSSLELSQQAVLAAFRLRGRTNYYSCKAIDVSQLCQILRGVYAHAGLYSCRRICHKPSRTEAASAELGIRGFSKAGITALNKDSIKDQRNDRFAHQRRATRHDNGVIWSPGFPSSLLVLPCDIVLSGDLVLQCFVELSKTLEVQTF